MGKALLPIRRVDRIVGGPEIRDQNTIEGFCEKSL
jgi:hypothetical protein